MQMNQFYHQKNLCQNLNIFLSRLCLATTLATLTKSEDLLKVTQPTEFKSTAHCIFLLIKLQRVMDTSQKITQKKNPRENANFLSICFFWWMNSLLGEGYRKELEMEDLFEVRKQDESEILGDRLERFDQDLECHCCTVLFRNWFKELEKAELKKKENKSEYNPSLFKALFKTFGPYYCFLGIFTLFEECIIRVFQPLFMGINI